MCKKYKIEFWSPFNNPSASAERRVFRGLDKPGRNLNAKRETFWIHEDEILDRPICRSPSDGGYYKNQILDFCFKDMACGDRLDHFETEYERCGRACRTAEKRRESKERQRELAQAWLDAYQEWVSAYTSHKDCPRRRNAHGLFQMLKRANVCQGMLDLEDRTRIGTNLHTVEIPTVL